MGNDSTGSSGKLERRLPDRIRRRTIIKGAAWSLPVIAATAATPLAAASVPCAHGQQTFGPGTYDFTVPSCVTSVTVTVVGGGGGGATAAIAGVTGQNGGNGALIQGVISVPGGTVLQLIVGAGGGGSNTGQGGSGFGPGGNGGHANRAGLEGGGGGGGSAVRLEPWFTPLVVAGGGGGGGSMAGGSSNIEIRGTHGGPGGSAGSADTGTDARVMMNSQALYAHGGSPASGGTGGAPGANAGSGGSPNQGFRTDFRPGTSGADNSSGGAGGTAFGYDSAGPGGGGGGYAGGGSGSAVHMDNGSGSPYQSVSAGSGGGAGSNYIDPTVSVITSPQNAGNYGRAGQNGGDGWITIQW